MDPSRQVPLEAAMDVIAVPRTKSPAVKPLKKSV